MMNKPITLCDRCDMGANCTLYYDNIYCRKFRTVQPTNADSIRAMTDEKLAEWLDKHVVGSKCMGHDCLTKKHYKNTKNYKQAWLEWLREGVSE